MNYFNRNVRGKDTRGMGNRVLGLMLLMSLASPGAHGQDQNESGDLSALLDRARDRVHLFDSTISRISWRAESSLRELDPRDLKKTKRTLEGVRYTQHWSKPERTSNEILEMRENGRPMTQREIQAEMRRQGGGAGFRFLNPFSPETKPHYQYDWRGEEMVDGERVVRVGFQTAKKESGYFTGFAKMEGKTGNIRELHLVPTRYPFLVTDFHLHMIFGPEKDGETAWWVPKSVEIDLRVTAKFVLTFADIPMTISETYGAYEFRRFEK